MPEGDGSAPDRFLVDAMCGTLVTYLRMCGYDTAYALDRGVEADGALLDLARAENRTLLTRDRQLATGADRAIALDARDVRDQLRTLGGAGVALELPAEPRRCSDCNGTLDRVDADGERPAHAPDAGDRPVWRCVACGKQFWRGSHWDDVAATLAGL